ncbi:MAG: membrane protein insertase YidC [Verrucomicrobiota bacterium]
MYDRKTWVVLSLCAALLGANLYISSKNQKEKLRADAAQQAVKKDTATAQAVTRESKAELTVETPPPPTEEKMVDLRTSEVIFYLTNYGGGVKYADFRKQFQVGSTEVPVRVNRFGTAPIGAIYDGDRTPENVIYSYKEDESIPGKKAVYVGKLPSGLIVKKTFSTRETNEPGAQYILDFNVVVENSLTANVRLGNWGIFLGEASPLYEAELRDQTGFFWRENKEMHFEQMADSMFSSKPSLTPSPHGIPVEFAGVTNQFFTTVLQPAQTANTHVWGRVSPVTIQNGGKTHDSVSAGLQFPDADLAPGKDNKSKFDYRIFIGPRHNPLLRSMENKWGDGWGEVMQYGWFSPVSRVLNWLLNQYHRLLDGVAQKWAWGLAIILLTITVRIAIWPLHAKSTRTMKRMSKLKPEMDKLKEKYPNDPNKLNTEMMGLYRKFGINPLGGCLPMFIQIPIFFGFYRMLQYAVELRGQGFLWVDDLSQPDTIAYLGSVPINLLPIVMAITSFLQIRMTPSTGDKMQQRIIMFMPFIFFFFCYNFASALALYWTTQNIFSIGQTWLMNKIPEPELSPAKGAGKKSWVQRMAEKQAEMQKRQREGNMRDVTPEKAKKPRGPRTGG